MPLHYIYLILAVAPETVATHPLPPRPQFTRLVPSLIVVGGYGIAFFLLSLTLRVMPVGIVYAIWSGLGIVFIAVIGLVVFGQRLDLPAILGISMIMAGILVIHLFSGASPH